MRVSRLEFRVVCLLTTLVASCSGSTKNFDLDSCQVQLSCGSHLSNSQIPGQKGEKGEPCDCDNQLSNVERRLADLSRPRCPETKFDFPSTGQITDMIRLKIPIPPLSELSVCVVITLHSASGGARSILSYATTAFDNAFLLEHTSSRIGIWINGVQKNVNLVLNVGTQLCVVAAPEYGWAKVYKNGNLVSQVSYPGSSVIAGGGVLLLGQEQDAYMSRLDPSQSFAGLLENLMMWFRVLEQDEVTALSNDRCSCPQGYDVGFTSNEIQISGKVALLPVEGC